MTHGAVGWLAAAYVGVLTAELVGDRSLFALGALAARFRPVAVWCGVVPAFMGKAAAAVLIGGFIAGLPRPLLTAATTASFLGSALVLWRARDAERDAERVVERSTGGDWTAAAPAAFSAVFFTEWADIGQLTAAGIAARSHAPLWVWLGATLALATKGALAVTLGVGLRRFVPLRMMRPAAIGVCLAMGVLSLLVAD